MEALRGAVFLLLQYICSSKSRCSLVIPVISSSYSSDLKDSTSRRLVPWILLYKFLTFAKTVSRGLAYHFDNPGYAVGDIGILLGGIPTHIIYLFFIIYLVIERHSASDAVVVLCQTLRYLGLSQAISNGTSRNRVPTENMLMNKF